ncbi:DUF58 domain-containing protein [Candidatus Enterococcus leclercqii]|uniref:DUF58 domain-containing protein n=1 Tax=Candidatus Enterococcus leclercqii TaxID=1857218 RepID=UPI001379EF08|nr:DUF58 domain-containing protein [Enterococcus sp. CU9D]KAF1291887.1 hypothetical protein BAU14_04975 [Enterococcus sp. CU9D]
MILFFSLLLLLLLFGLRHYWLANWQKGLSVAVEMKQARVFPGETFTIRQIVYNEKAFGLPFLRLLIPFVDSFYLVTAAKEKPVNDLFQVFSLASWSRSEKVFRIRGTKRGVYHLSEIELHCRSLLFPEAVTQKYPLNKEIIVFPKQVSTQEVFQIFQQSLGEQLAQQGLLPDPLSFRGIREYRTGDPIKQLDHKKSAQMNQWMIREYDPTANQEVTLILDLPESSDWKNDPLAEATISLFTTIAAECQKLGYLTRCRSNGRDKEGQLLFNDTLLSRAAILQSASQLVLKQTAATTDHLQDNVASNKSCYIFTSDAAWDNTKAALLQATGGEAATVVIATRLPQNLQQDGRLIIREWVIQ